MPFSENLCMLMKQNHLSSYKLAKTIGVHVSTITNWKNGSMPVAKHLQLLSDCFGVPINQLLAPLEQNSA